MTYYLDTSALAKRYLRQPGADRIRQLFRQKRPLVVSRLAYAELAAVVARACRERLIAEPARDAILAGLDRDFAALEVVEARPAVLQRVPKLVVRSPLRGYDAVHLASALVVSEQGIAIEFCSADKRLVECARNEGLRATLF